MIWTIVRREFLNNVIQFRFAVVTIVSVTLAVLSTLIGMKDYRQRVDDYFEALAAERASLDKITVYSYLQPVIVKPPQPLSMITRGHEAKLRESLRIEPFRVPTPEHMLHTQEWSGRNEYLAGFFAFDLTATVRIFLGLLALLFAFDAIAGEKEKGTLSLAFSNPLTRVKFFLGKYLGGMLGLILPTVACFLIAIILILFSSGSVFTEEQWLRVGITLISYLIFLSFMFLLGLLISASTVRSSTSLVLCLLVWLLSVEIIPNAGAFIAEQAVQVPSRHSIYMKFEDIWPEKWRRVEEYEKRLERPVGPYFIGYYSEDESVTRSVLRRLLHPKAYDYLEKLHSFMNQQFYEEGMKFHRIDIEYYGILERQAKLARRLSELSPSTLLETICQRLACTSIGDYEHFLDEARQYHSTFISYMHDKRAFSSRRWFTDDPLDQRPAIPDPEHFDFSSVGPSFWSDIQLRGEELGRDPRRKLDLSDLPSFRHRPLSLAESVSSSLFEISTLILGNLACFFLGLILFLRYDLR